MRSFFYGIFIVLIAVNTFSATKKVVFLSGYASEQTPQNIVKNIKYIETLPFDGVTIFAEPFRSQAMSKGSTITYQQVYDQNLKLVQGISTKVNYNWAVIYLSGTTTGPPDWYDDASWNLVINNWRMFARACKAAGLIGISFDNENYGHRGHYDYPGEVDSASKYPLQQYRDQARLRGKQIMQTCIQEYPNIQVMFYMGPDLSEPKLPSFVDGNHSSGFELAGPFFVGAYEATIGTQAYVHAGCECAYGYRTLTRYQQTYNWLKDTIVLASNNSPSIPVSLRPSWSQKVKISFATYTGNWPAGTTPVMSPTTMRNCLEYALRTCDDFTWFYTENQNWLVAPGTGAQPWLPAISGAKGAVNSGVYFNCEKAVNVQVGGSFSFKFTYDNFTGSTATLTYSKKPSWITAANGNQTITGTAPNNPSFDTVVAVVTAGGKSDTTKLAITVSSYYIIEAESGTLTAPIQKGSDPAASKGQYITTPAGAGNTIFPKIEATYTFNAPIAGTYYVWLKVYAPSINNTANYGTFYGFNGKFSKPGVANKLAGQYEYIMSPTPNTLTAGANQIILGHGSEQVRIDQIIITNSFSNELPAGVTSSLPNGKKNLMQQGKNLSIRITPDGGVQFLGSAFEDTHLSIRDIFGREIFSSQKSNGFVWSPRNGNLKANNGVYFVTLQQNGNAEIGRFALAR